jgi:hypothetical protein
MISTAYPKRIAVAFRWTIHQRLAVDVAADLGAVSVINSRDVSDPRTDPGVRVRGPEVGSLTSRLLSCVGDPHGEGRRAVSARGQCDDCP